MLESSLRVAAVIGLLAGCSPASLPKEPIAQGPAAAVSRRSEPNQPNEPVCPRGGWCDATRGVCVEPDIPDHAVFGLQEWLGKADADVPGHTPDKLHATYDEWDGLSRHLRVSFRGNGQYIIELDGLSGWNRASEADRAGNEAGRRLLQTGLLDGTSRAVPPFRSLPAVSCAGDISGFRAELVLVAEFARLHAYRGVWTHPGCRDFPRDYVDEIWSFVERETGGALRRFDRDKWGPLPPGAQPACHTPHNTCCGDCPAP